MIYSATLRDLIQRCQYGSAERTFIFAAVKCENTETVAHLTVRYRSESSTSYFDRRGWNALHLRVIRCFSNASACARSSLGRSCGQGKV